MQNIQEAGEKALNVRVPYQIFIEFEKRARNQKQTKTSIIIHLMNEWIEDQKEIEELGLSNEKEQLKNGLRDLKNGDYILLKDLKK